MAEDSIMSCQKPTRILYEYEYKYTAENENNIDEIILNPSTFQNKKHHINLCNFRTFINLIYITSLGMMSTFHSRKMKDSKCMDMYT